MKPQYIEDVAKKRKCYDELNFMKKIEHKPLSASPDPPEEIGQFVVNIDCKSHANHSDGCVESGSYSDKDRDKPDYRLRVK